MTYLNKYSLHDPSNSMSGNTHVSKSVPELELQVNSLPFYKKGSASKLCTCTNEFNR